ncbi:MAG: 6-bladed beta-propeller [Mediterranea massiliensis]|nr:6-bladed beta-propeller [Mediterranea massiliensis]
MIRVKLIFCLCMILQFIACSGKQQSDSVVEPLVVTDSLRCLDITLDAADSFDGLENYVKWDSYIKLDAEPLLAKIRTIRICGERIYILDRLHQLVCYDMTGKSLFNIHAIGNGPGEYSEITAFAVNTQTKEIAIYDGLQRKLHFYSSVNGRIRKSVGLEKPMPSEMVFWDNRYFYNNRDYGNYPNDKQLHYSLLSSVDGVHMDKYYFVHNELEEKYQFNPSLFTFYHNDNKLYYCKNFDYTVYEISKDSLMARYEMNLPNPLNLEKLAYNLDEWELIKSSYSFGITNVYECKDILYFRFCNDGYFWNVLYDLKQGRQICCVKSMLDEPTESIPLFDIVDGVYKNKFFGVLTPGIIDYYKEKFKMNYSDVFGDYDSESDNPIIVFYEVVYGR